MSSDFTPDQSMRNPDEAIAFVSELKEKGCYQQDVY